MFCQDKEGGCPHHMVCIHKGRFYTFDILDDGGDLLSAPEIEAQYQAILDSNVDREDGPGVGALTAHHRDDWKKVGHHRKVVIL